MSKSIYNIISLVNLIIGIVAVLFSIFLIFTTQDFCLRIDEARGCGFWHDTNLNIILPSLPWIFAPVYYFIKKSKISIYLNLIVLFAIPVLFAFIIKSF